ncbi:MAG: FtsK/SpoIIIE domain-containing protein, partial [Methanogenium sp.]
MKKKNDNLYDVVMDYIFNTCLFIGRSLMKYLFKLLKRTFLNSLQFKKILNNKFRQMTFYTSILAYLILIWVYKLHPGLYFFSPFVYFAFYTAYIEFLQVLKRKKIKRLNKKYKKIVELFDGKIDVVSVKENSIVIYSNCLTEKDISKNHTRLELFFNRKITEIRQQEKNLRYIDINFYMTSKFKAKYYLQQYIDFVQIDKKMNLPFILGIDEKNIIHMADMTKLNHVFISGESDTGKSVLLNQIIQSLMVFNSIIQYVLVDLKEGIELYDYSIFPHTLIISNMKELIKIIEYLEKEMITRLNKIKVSTGCKNIIQYNKNNSEKMNYIIMVIDEFATIKLENGEMKNLESKILSILQKGRAAGIYLIGATQRPSSNQINTDVRAGFLWNISLRVKTPETQRMTKIYGTEKLKVGEFKTDIVKDTTLKSFFIDENTHNGVFEDLVFSLIDKKEFIFIKEKEMKKLSIYKRLCNYVDTKIYKRRMIEYTKNFDYRHYIKVPSQKIITEIEHIKETYDIGQNNPVFDTCVQSDDYSKFLEYIFRNNKENGLLPSSKEIEGNLKITRYQR